MKNLILIFMLCLSTQSYALEVAGVKLDDKAQIDKYPLVLSGAGLRTKFVVKVYVAALYLAAKEHTAEAVLADTGAKRMSFILKRDVTGKQVHDGINQAILPNVSPEEMKALEGRMFSFEKIFTAVPEIKEGEIVNLDYIPDAGTLITIDGVKKGQIEGLDFNRALLKIWVGQKPIQGSLKKSLLGEE